MSDAVLAPAMLPPGKLAAQGKAIAALLQEVFPPTMFQFKYLPASITREGWKEITQGNQPFLGLGFVGVTPNGENRVFAGTASWMLLAAVRRQGSPKARFYGDEAPGGIGVLLMAGVAVAALHGRVAHTGTITVAKVANAVAEAWSEDSAVVSLDLRVPVTLDLADAISQPSGLGIFAAMSETWNVPAAGGGSTDIYSSDWENPND